MCNFMVVLCLATDSSNKTDYSNDSYEYFVVVLSSFVLCRILFRTLSIATRWFDSKALPLFQCITHKHNERRPFHSKNVFPTKTKFYSFLLIASCVLFFFFSFRNAFCFPFIFIHSRSPIEFVCWTTNHCQVVFRKMYLERVNKRKRNNAMNHTINYSYCWFHCVRRPSCCYVKRMENENVKHVANGDASASNGYNRIDKK